MPIAVALCLRDDLSAPPQRSAEHRRQGVGGALLDAVRAAGGELGIALVALDLWSFNASARAFFHRRGFTPYNERLWNR